VLIVVAGTFIGALKGFPAFGRWAAALEKVSVRHHHRSGLAPGLAVVRGRRDIEGRG
jgi:hypothetical protein